MANQEYGVVAHHRLFIDLTVIGATEQAIQEWEHSILHELLSRVGSKKRMKTYNIARVTTKGIGAEGRKV